MVRSQGGALGQQRVPFSGHDSAFIEEALFSVLRRRFSPVTPRALARLVCQATGAPAHIVLKTLRAMIGDGRLQMTAPHHMAPLGHLPRAGGDSPLSLSLSLSR